jgi:hypothetical protein
MPRIAKRGLDDTVERCGQQVFGRPYGVRMYVNCQGKVGE